ncbi:MAG: hypothetical protein AABX95_04455 [Nanoarchaeota archaeon]
MEMSSEDLLESVAKGATKGVLQWGENFIRSLADRFKKKEISFINDKKTLDVVREQYNSGELQIYKNYINDKTKLMILRMGLVLRKLDKNGEKQRRQKLREDIIKKSMHHHTLKGVV